jgi:hypothetical protein
MNEGLPRTIGQNGMQLLKPETAQRLQGRLTAMGMANVLKGPHTHMAVARQILHAHTAGVMLRHVSHQDRHHVMAIGRCQQNAGHMAGTNRPARFVERNVGGTNHWPHPQGTFF